MKKIIFLILLVITMLICVCFCGCNKADSASFSNDNFEVVATEEDFDTYYVIMYHKQTKVMYLFIHSGYAGGLTVMVDENGEPLLYQGE